MIDLQTISDKARPFPSIVGSPVDAKTIYTGDALISAQQRQGFLRHWPKSSDHHAVTCTSRVSKKCSGVNSARNSATGPRPSKPW